MSLFSSVASFLLFCKLVNKKIESRIIYEDDIVLACLDSYPDACGHTLIIPKKHYEDFYKRYRLDSIPYIAEDTYEGKAPKPNKEYNGKRVFTMDNWFCDVGVEGDLVDNEIAMELANCVPPAYFSTGLIQSGEPADHRKEGVVYATFLRVDDDVWEYKGDCLRGKPEEHGTLLPVV